MTASPGALNRSFFLRIFAVLVLSIFLTSGPTYTSVTAATVSTFGTFETQERVAALTFDAGADRGYAELILNTLSQKGVVATFGMTGVWAEQNPDLIRRIVRDGHQLINHTYNHPSFTGASTNNSPPLSAAQRADQLRRTEEVVRTIAGVEMKPYFRPPYGDYDQSVLNDLAANGYLYNIMWTVDTLGWQGLSASAIRQRVLAAEQPGMNVLMHVGAASNDGPALSGMIDDLRARGYRFDTVRNLVEGERYFNQTGQSVSGNFLQYWNQFGGLAVYGYPVSPEMTVDGIKTQYFERARFELHPGNWPARFDVQLGRLGAELTADRRVDAPFQRVSAQGNQNCNYYSQTGHRLCNGFRAYWERFGGLAVYGYPISEEFREVNADTGETYVVQYFERQRFEWHPGEWPSRYDVMLGRVGAQSYTE